MSTEATTMIPITAPGTVTAALEVPVTVTAGLYLTAIANAANYTLWPGEPNAINRSLSLLDTIVSLARLRHLGLTLTQEHLADALRRQVGRTVAAKLEAWHA